MLQYLVIRDGSFRTDNERLTLSTGEARDGFSTEYHRGRGTFGAMIQHSLDVSNETRYECRGRWLGSLVSPLMESK